MTEIRFYHLTRSRMEEALPDLLEKTLSKGWRALIKTGQAAHLGDLSALLWTWRSNSFLPHGWAGEGPDPAAQPIWLTSTDENPNGATVLFLIEGAQAPALAGYDLVCEIFNGLDAESLAVARQKWAAYREQGFALAYWQQTEKGWTQKTL